jgi:hypothetical protein
VRSPTLCGKDRKRDGQVGGSADDRPEQAAKPGGHRGGRDANAELAKAARTDHSSAFDRSCARPQCAAPSAAESDQSSSPEPSRLARVWARAARRQAGDRGQQLVRHPPAGHRDLEQQADGSG